MSRIDSVAADRPILAHPWRLENGEWGVIIKKPKEGVPHLHRVPGAYVLVHTKSGRTFWKVLSRKVSETETHEIFLTQKKP